MPTSDNVPQCGSSAKTKAVNGVHFFSCYFLPSLSFTKYRHGLDILVGETPNIWPIVIAEDFNAWTIEWRSKFTNARWGCVLKEFSALNVIS